MDRDDFRKALKAKKDKLSKESQTADQKKSGPHSQAGASPQEPTKTREVDEGELMATAFEALSTGTVNIEWERTQVVLEKSPPDAHDASASAAPTSAPEPAAVQASTPAPPPLDPAQWQGRDWEGQDFFTGQGDRINAEQPFAQVQANQLSPAQTRLLERIAKIQPSEIQELNLRHLSRDEAMGQLRRQAAQMRRLGQRYLRIITGKGIGSAGAPILRLAVVHWCILQAKKQALQWTPEPENNREYGSIFIDLQGQGART